MVHLGINIQYVISFNEPLLIGSKRGKKGEAPSKPGRSHEKAKV